MQLRLGTDAVDGVGGGAPVPLDQEGLLGEEPDQVRLGGALYGDPHSVCRAVGVLLGQLKVDEAAALPGEAAQAAAVVQMPQPSELSRVTIGHSVVAVHRFSHCVEVRYELVRVEAWRAREGVEVDRGHKLLHELEGSDASGARLRRAALQGQVGLVGSEGGSPCSG